MISKIKNCILVINAFNKEAQNIADNIVSFLNKENIRADFFYFSNTSEECRFENYDFAITLGGDGTVLFAARGCFACGVPIFPVNLGHFGFIAGIQKTEWKEKLELYLNDRLSITSRTLLKGDVIKKGKKIFSTVALNDIVVSSKTAARILNLDIHFNDNSFGKFKVDGVIMSTPTGSTGYSVAAGGPIIAPSVTGFVFTPICPFTLSSRPLVLPVDGVLRIEVLPSRNVFAQFTADGQINFDLDDGDIIEIKKASKEVLLIGCGSHVFYSALRSKLNWSGGSFD